MTNNLKIIICVRGGTLLFGECLLFSLCCSNVVFEASNLHSSDFNYYYYYYYYYNYYFNSPIVMHGIYLCYGCEMSINLYVICLSI